MPDSKIVETIAAKFDALAGDLDERAKRRWAAAEAIALGYGGISAVAVATGMSDRTIRNGVAELKSKSPLPSDRQRRPGAGRKPLQWHQHDLERALDRLVEPSERGDPQSPLRWTCKSLTNLQNELRQQGYKVGRTKIGQMLYSMGYSLQSNRKTQEGSRHPDRNAQFEHIAKRVKACSRSGRPAISVDTKKKEILGKKSNSGREYRPAGEPTLVDTHDFPDPALGKAIPYGVYDIGYNEAWVSIGITSDTAEFAVQAIRLWYKRLEKEKFKWPRKDSGDVVSLNEEQLHWLLRGFDISQLQSHKTLHYCSEV